MGGTIKFILIIRQFYVIRLSRSFKFFAFSSSQAQTKKYKLYLKNKTEISGLIFDILEIMQDIYRFTIDFKISADLNYGAKVNGTWNGLVKMLLDQEIDLAAAILSMTHERYQGINKSLRNQETN